MKVDRVILRRENRSIGRKNYISDTLSVKKFTSTGPGKNPTLPGEKPANNHFNPEMTLMDGDFTSIRIIKLETDDRQNIHCSTNTDRVVNACH
jgi:hypothetical protein